MLLCSRSLACRPKRYFQSTECTNLRASNKRVSLREVFSRKHSSSTSRRPTPVPASSNLQQRQSEAVRAVPARRHRVCRPDRLSSSPTFVTLTWQYWTSSLNRNAKALRLTCGTAVLSAPQQAGMKAMSGNAISVLVTSLRPLGRGLSTILSLPVDISCTHVPGDIALHWAPESP